MLAGMDLYLGEQQELTQKEACGEEEEVGSLIPISHSSSVGYEIQKCTLPLSKCGNVFRQIKYFPISDCNFFT